jgi:putative tricarboxylic transport membrane protein
MTDAAAPDPTRPSTAKPSLEDTIDAEELRAELEQERPARAGPAAQVAAALVALAIGVFGAVVSSGLGLGQLTQPGPGLWPFAISVVIVVLSAVLVFVGRNATDGERFSKASLLTVLALVTLVLLAVLLPLTGFEIPSLVLVFVWLRWLGKESWRSSVVISVAAVAAVHLLFVVLLQIPLPRLI